MSPHLAITGFHRSGTSLAADIVHRSGLHLGDRLLGPLPSNPRGHFEDLGIVHFHDELLRANSRSWVVSDPFVPDIPDALRARARQLIEDRDAANSSWGFKDPRSSLFLDQWKEWLPDLRVIAVYRPPGPACASLVTREVALPRRWWRRDPGRAIVRTPAVAYEMWEVYNSAIAEYSRRHLDDVLLVPASSLATGTKLSDRLRRWGFDIDSVDQAAVYRHELMRSDDNSHIPSQLAAIWESLNALAAQS
ncbi:MAG: hypothetical protein HKN80_13725 [Acidimicrobiia bacterium]|nr:hypothetical protein [Acidimicrobiia bacterium]